MAIDIENDDLLTVAGAAKYIHGRPSTRTIWRWMEKGVHGVKLDSVKIGSHRFTSKQAIRRFVCATTKAADARRPELSATRKRAIKRAERELADAGL